jgi:hypothetical protein
MAINGVWPEHVAVMNRRKDRVVPHGAACGFATSGPGPSPTADRCAFSKGAESAFETLPNWAGFALAPFYIV